jgi:lysophospholipase L1-like esterase
MRSMLKSVGLALLATAASLAVLGVAEVALRAFGVAADARRDPFAGFSNLVPMFERAERADGVQVLRTARGRRAVEPQEFLAEKPPGGFRAFVVGGSSAAGVPYTHTHSFAGWLGRRLDRELPGVRVEVVNAAVSGYASRRILSVTREIASHAPDLLIVYSGHNETAELRYYKHLIDMDPRLFRLWQSFASLRLYAVLSRLPFLGASDQPPQLEFGDIKNAYQMFAAGTARLENPASERERLYGELHYRFNLEQMIQAIQGVGARVMLLSLSQNYADWEPAASSHRADLTQSEREEWESELLEGARLSAGGECSRALGAYQRALAIDGQHALLHFRVAGCHRELGDLEKARLHYRLASDLDRVPHGAPSRYNEILRELATEYGTLFVDVDAILEAESPGGMVGDDFFVDLVHPNLRANQRIAAAIAEELRANGIPVKRERWRVGAHVEENVDALYREDPYFELQEQLVRSSACLLAHRWRCGHEAAEAALAIDPDHAWAQQLASVAARGLEE